MTTYPHNTIVYDLHGARARYISHTPEGHLVIPTIEVYLGDESEEQDGSVALWHEVFLRPPTEKLNEEVANLNKTLQTLRAEISEVRIQRREVDVEIAARRARIAQHKQLATLDEFLTKGISHYVKVDWSGVKIITLASTEQTEYGPKGFKLLTLFGYSNGDLTWKLNDYKDGSGGGWTQVYPTNSLEEARLIAARVLEEKWTEWRAKPDAYCHLDSYVKSSAALGFSIPEDVHAHVKAKEVVSKQTAVDKAQKELDDAKAALEAVQIA